MISRRTGMQRICILLGVFFVALALIGMSQPEFLRLSLSVAHHFIQLMTGSLCLWSGFSDEPKKSYLLGWSLGTFYALMGLCGFVFGNLGFTGLGDGHSDPYLWRPIPNFFEPISTDHIFHLIIGFIFLAGAFFWKLKVDSIARSIVEIQRRDE